MTTSKAIFLDLNYKIKDNVSYVELLLKGKKTGKLLYQFDPYFYVDCDKKEKSTLEKVTTKSRFGDTITPKSVELVERDVDGKPKKIFKITCHTPADVQPLKSSIPFKYYESRILFIKRFLLDFNLKPFSEIEYERDGEIITKIINVNKSSNIQLSKCSFDIETYNPLGAPREKEDPIIMISYKSGDKSEVLTYKKTNQDFVQSFKDERETIEYFLKVLEKEDPDILYGYNSTNFDIPYLKERAAELKIPFELGRWESDFKKIRKGLTSGLILNGRIHLDLYPMMRFLGILGILKSKRFTLEAVYNELGSGTKKMVERRDIWKMWDDENELEELAEYSLYDAKTTYELGEITTNLFIELSKLTGLPLFETSLSTSGQLVEFLLMQESVKRKMVIPPRPKDSEISERLANPIEGAFVKIPIPGIYENIVVLDFRGLYPSIIISYNVDPYMLTDSKEDVNTSPSNWNFKKSPSGLIPSVLKHLVDSRAQMKRDLKNLKKGSDEYNILSARSQSYKIISNSFYGYLGYARSRWYNRQCAESVTSWGREHIQNTIKTAEKCGFKVLYGDTDSVFLLMNEKSKEDVSGFMEEVNTSLPEDMELELEGFYPTGVFVGKRSGDKKGKGAKKKYALLAEDGSIKIRGFALVRRDWSTIAKNTQKAVLETILREKDKEKAAKIVKDTIKRLKSGEVPLEELVIYTQITKDPENYDIMSPEVSAAKKAIKKGLIVQKGTIIGYIIGRNGKSISEKAVHIDFATTYDPDYYINNQVLPSVMKLLQELGYSEDDLKFGGKQTGLGNFF